MKIPKTTKICGYKYKVEYVDDKMRDGDEVGSCNFRKQLITIDINQCEEGQKSTYLHERIEAVNYHYELNLPHSVISILETAMSEFITQDKL